MNTLINEKIREIVESGTYYIKPYNESISDTQKNMGINQYHYYIKTADNTLHFTYKTGSFSLSLKDFDWKIIWDKLGDIPVDDDDCIEAPFEHFDIGTERMEIWHWFEWFFDIQLGGNI